MKPKYKLILFVVTSTLSLSASNSHNEISTIEDESIITSVIPVADSGDSDQALQCASEDGGDSLSGNGC